MNPWRAFGKLTKVTEQADGTLLVEGVASSESVDSQGEVVKASAMAAALPEYMRFPALREMHQPWAAGRTLGCTVEDGKTYISAKVVDAEACKKVREGVYGGFSIGGHVPPGGRNATDPKVIEQIVLTEISLVDRPANPDAVLLLAKIEKVGEKRPVGSAADHHETNGAAPGARAEQAASNQVEVDPAAGNPFKAGQSVKLPDGTTAVVASVRGAEVVTERGTFLASALSLVEAAPQPDNGIKADTAITVKVGAADAEAVRAFIESPAFAKLFAAARPPLKKGMYTVARAAALLDELLSLQQCTAYEAQAEGDGSPVPAQLAAQVAALAATLRAMVAEETAELQAQTEPVADMVASAAPAGPVAKKGAKFSAQTAKALADIHSQIQACDKAMGALGYTAKDDDGDDDDVGNAAAVGDLQKRATEAEAATKAAGEALAKVLEEREALKAEIASLKARKPLRAVSKTEDAGGTEKAAEPPPPPEGTPERAHYELKKVHAAGGRPVQFALNR